MDADQLEGFFRDTGFGHLTREQRHVHDAMEMVFGVDDGQRHESMLEKEAAGVAHRRPGGERQHLRRHDRGHLNVRIAHQQSPCGNDTLQTPFGIDDVKVDNFLAQFL